MPFVNTLKYGLRKMTGASLARDIDDGFAALADDIDAKMTGYSSGTFASRPTSTPGSPGVEGRFYRATDTGQIFLDTGTGWVELTFNQAGFIAGDIKATARSVAPAGWVMCDGAVVPRTGTYAALFAAIGTAYGAGDGTTTFQLPDLRGRVPVGVDGTAGRLTTNDALGQVGGKETLAAADLPAHTHTAAGLSIAAGGSHVHSPNWPGGFVTATGTVLTAIPGGGAGSQRAPWSGSSSDEFGGTLFTNSAGNHTHNISGATGSTGGGSDGNNMPPYQAVNWLIKL